MNTDKLRDALNQYEKRTDEIRDLKRQKETTKEFLVGECIEQGLNYVIEVNIPKLRQALRTR
jgi:hypothetical protein